MAHNLTNIILRCVSWSGLDHGLVPTRQQDVISGLDLNFHGHLSRRTSEIENLPVLHEMTPAHAIIYVIIFWLLTCPVRQVSL